MLRVPRSALPLLAVLVVSCAATGDETRTDAASGTQTEDAGVVVPAEDAGPPPPGAGDAGPTHDAGRAHDAGPTAPDSGPTASSVVSVNGCEAASAGCMCVSLVEGGSCTHTLGGVYSNLGCSGGYQCCDGVWRKGVAVCGTCLCTDATGELGCAASDGATALCHPVFEGSASAIPADVQAEMTGVSWKADLDCPPFAELRLLRLSHWTFDGAVAEGELVVHESAANEMLQVFEALFDARFPIERMQRVDAYGADDDASMAANNTSAFNCRLTTSGTQLSQHSYGTAVDINPLRNPYVTSGGTVYPPGGSAYVDRSFVRPGMIVQPGPVVTAFDAIGWGWGGRWRSSKDYQHFSRNGL